MMNKRILYTTAGITLISFLIIGFLLTSSTSMISSSPEIINIESENVIEYSDNDKTVEIKDKDNEEIAKVKLISHKDVNEPINVMPGKNRRVMIYEIENLKDFNNAIGNIEIININNGKIENKKFHLEYAIYDYVQNPVYEYSYENVTENYPYLIDGEYKSHKYESCNREIIGYTNDYEIVGWENLKSMDINKGNITIALVTDVRDGDHYDGVFTLFGKKIDKHAEWTAGLNIGLVSYYKLNEGYSGSGSIIDSINMRNNLTNNGATNVSGIINSAYYFDGSDSISNPTTFDFGNSGNIPKSINIWVNDTSSDSGWRGYIAFGTFSTSNTMAIGTNAGAYYLMTYGSDWVPGPSTILDAWTMLTLTYDGSDSKFYINGANVANTSSAIYNTPASPNFFLGQVIEGSGKYLGDLDEAGIWNKTLSDAEIIQLYNSGVGISWTDDFGQPLNITGTLKDSDGNGIKGIIQITHQETNTSQFTISNTSGFWTFEDIDAGNYTATARDIINKSIPGDTKPFIVVSE